MQPGTTIGSYQVLAKLGAGGMGEVYRARDHKLQRDVAIKVLPEVFHADPERLARFEREARALAALNHPHIAAIYAVEGRALIMELVEGEDLGERLGRGPIPVAEALPIARQIAMALEAAHEAGIVHRDLKPANVRVRPDDTVKVLDFGLAKLVQPEAASDTNSAANSPTITSFGATQHGMILGTAAYMSPEQARGKAVDRRSDVWAFGCVFFEMLTGRPVFAGDNVTDTLAAIVRSEPDWTSLPADTPHSVRRLLARCLVKDRARRLADVSTARLEIDEAGEAGDPRANFMRAEDVSGRSRFGMLLTGLLTGLVIAGGAAWMMQPRSDVALPVHLAVELPAGYRPTGSSGPGIAISRDGQRVAQIVTGADNVARLMIRKLDASAGSLVPDSAHARAPFFSPEGNDVGFFAEGRLLRVPAGGGAAFKIASIDNLVRGGSWAPDGFIYVGASSGLLRVPASGGAFETVVGLNAAAGDVAIRFPIALPNGRGVLFTNFRGALENSRLGVVDLRTKQVRELMQQPGSSPRYLPNGQLLFLRSGNLLTVPFDADRLEVTGAPQPILSGVAFNNGGAGHFDVSETGTLAYVPELPLNTGQFVWMDRAGRVEPTALPEDTWRDGVLSPNGQQLALVRAVSDGTEIRIWDFARAEMRGLKRGPSSLNNGPVWTADGKDLVFTNRPDGVGSVGRIFRVAADGSRPAEPLLSNEFTAMKGGSAQNPGSVTRDGTHLLFAQTATDHDGIYRLRLGSTTVERLVEGGACPSVSADSLHFAHLAVGRVWVRPMADAAKTQWLVSSENSTCPVWSDDGRELFFETAGQFMAVTANAPAGFADVRPRLLFPIPEFHRFRDAASDGQKFLFLRSNPPLPVLPQVIANWPPASGKR